MAHSSHQRKSLLLPNQVGWDEKEGDGACVPNKRKMGHQPRPVSTPAQKFFIFAISSCSDTTLQLLDTNHESSTGQTIKLQSGQMSAKAL